MRRIFILVSSMLIAASFASCARVCRDTTLYQRSGRAKPIVAVLPVINNSSKNNLPWDLSREMTEEIRRRVFDSSRLYLLRESCNPELTRALCAAHPSTLPKNVREQLGAAEFVVVAELLDQEETPYGISKVGSDKSHLEEVGSVLSVAMRLRVLDIREEQPKIILQEILNQEHVISRAYLNCDYERACWGTEAFERTTMGIAHSRIIRELVSRVEGYVGASKG
jgi:hypothetical protein